MRARTIRNALVVLSVLLVHYFHDAVLFNAEDERVLARA